MSTLNVIRAALFTPSNNGWGVPLTLRSKPGTGKTTIIEASEDRWGIVANTFTPSQHDQAEMGGIAHPSDDGFTFSKLVGQFCKHWFDLSRGIILFDELTTQSEAEQRILLRAITHKEICGRPLPAGVRMLGAYNPADSSTGGNALAPAVANRLGHVDWDGDLEGWASYMNGESEDTQAEDPADIEERVMSAWPREFRRATDDVYSFLHTSPSSFHAMPDDPELRSGAWPSPRTWELATRALASSRIHGLDAKDTHTFVAAWIGKGTASEFLQSLDKPMPTLSEVTSEQWKPTASAPDVALRVLLMLDQARSANSVTRTQFWKTVTAVGKTPGMLGLAAAVGGRVARSLSAKGEQPWSASDPTEKACAEMLAPVLVSVATRK